MPPNQPAQLKPVTSAPSPAASPAPASPKPAGDKASFPGLDAFKSIFTSASANSDKALKASTTSNKNTLTQSALQPSNSLLTYMSSMFGAKAVDKNKKDTNPIDSAFGKLGMLGGLLTGNDNVEETSTTGEVIAEETDTSLQDEANNTIISSLPVVESDVSKINSSIDSIRDVLFSIFDMQQQMVNSLLEANIQKQLEQSVGTEAGAAPSKLEQKEPEKLKEEEEGGGFFKDLIDDIKMFGPILGSLGSSLLSLSASILPVIAVIALLAFAGYLIYKNWDTIAKQVSGLWDKTFGLFTGMFTKFMSGNILGALFDYFIGMPAMFSSWILLGLKGIFNFLANIPLKLVEWIGGLLGFDVSEYVSAFKVGLDMINEGFDFLIDFFSNISTYAAPVIDVINSVFVLLGGLFMDAILHPILFVWEIIKGVFSTIVAEIQIGIALVKGYIDAVWGTIKIVFDAISSIFSTLYDFVTGKISFTEMMSTIWDIISGIPEKIWNMLTGVFDSVTSSISSIAGGWFDSIKTMLTNILDLLLGPLKRIGNFFGIKIGEEEKKDNIGKKLDTNKNQGKLPMAPEPPVIAQSQKGPEIKPGQSTSAKAANPLREQLQIKDELNNQNKMTPIVAQQTNQTNVANNATTYQTQMVSANNSRSAIFGPRGV